MRKRFYIFFVARDEAGQLRKISIPVQYAYVLVAGLVIGGLCLTGIASSYTRMLAKVSHYNQLRRDHAQLKDRYSRLELVAKERDIQVASLGSLASEVSALYGLKSDPAMVAASTEQIQEAQVHSSLDQLYALRHTALSWSRKRRHLTRPHQELDHGRLDPRQFRSELVAGRRPDYRFLRRAYRSV